MTKTGHTYVDTKTRNAERAIAFAYRQRAVGLSPWPGPVGLVVVACLTPPSSKPKWWQNVASLGGIVPLVKPDLDNVTKLVKDALNGVAWTDDAHVVAEYAYKRYVSDNNGTAILVVFGGQPTNLAAANAGDIGDWRGDIGEPTWPGLISKRCSCCGAILPDNCFKGARCIACAQR